MRQKFFFITFVLFLLPLTAQALSAGLKQKYPYAVLTEDYGILNEIDLDSELDGVKHPQMFSTKTKGYIYWQCFPRDSVIISLEDTGESKEDDPGSDVKYNGENDARLVISGLGRQGILHKYRMWRNFPISQTEDQFNRYLKLLRGEKNVCIAGSYLEKETKKIVGEVETTRQKIYFWGFEKVKTTKGCEAYHKNGCHYNLKT